MRISIDELIRTVPKKQLERVIKECVNWTYTRLYLEEEITGVNEPYIGCLTHEARYIDDIVGFNELNVIRKSMKEDSLADKWGFAKDYIIDSIGETTQELLYKATGYHHKGLEDIITVSEVPIRVNYDANGNWIEVEDTSELYSVLLQLIVVYSLYRFPKQIGHLSVVPSDITYIGNVLKLQTPTNLSDNYGIAYMDEAEKRLLTCINRG